METHAPFVGLNPVIWMQSNPLGVQQLIQCKEIELKLRHV